MLHRKFIRFKHGYVLYIEINFPIKIEQLFEETNDGPEVSLEKTGRRGLSRQSYDRKIPLHWQIARTVEIGSNDGQSSWREAASHPSLIISLVAATFRRRCSAGTIRNRGKWISFYEFPSWNFRAHCTRPMFSDDRSWITDNSWPFSLSIAWSCPINVFRNHVFTVLLIKRINYAFSTEPIKMFKKFRQTI